MSQTGHTADGGPAFPICTPDMNVGDDAGPGMSMRDYFAGQALVGILSMAGSAGVVLFPNDDLAQQAYATADAMLQARAALSKAQPETGATP